MPVLSMVSPKGGVGKTTVAALLGVEFARSGQDVTIIDADPNRPLADWSKRPGIPDNLTIILDDDETTILDNIDEARRRSRLVIVDLEGTANTRVAYAVSRSNLVLIPCQGSKLDANEAVKAIRLVKRQERAFEREIPYAVLWTKLPVSYETRNLKALSAQFEEYKIPVLETRVYQRDAFVTMFDMGGTIHELKESQAPGLPRARLNANALAVEVVKIFQGQTEGKRGAGTDQNTAVEGVAHV